VLIELKIERASKRRKPLRPKAEKAKSAPAGEAALFNPTQIPKNDEISPYITELSSLLQAVLPPQPFVPMHCRLADRARYRPGQSLLDRVSMAIQ
jgi:hypothetical protein